MQSTGVRAAQGEGPRSERRQALETGAGKARAGASDVVRASGRGTRAAGAKVGSARGQEQMLERVVAALTQRPEQNARTTQANWHQVSTGAGAAWFGRCRSGTWATPSGWRERARGDARKLAVYADVGRPEQSEPMSMNRRCWSTTCRAMARAGGVRWKAVARDAGTRWPYRGCS
jgi:hypothetical protein